MKSISSNPSFWRTLPPTELPLSKIVVLVNASSACKNMSCGVHRSTNKAKDVLALAINEAS
ncbi:hypothetical protein ES288_D07G111700v1 [Gossypium darwinii]|uniref:Uncharacterized protein n=1 Tax=Gossypium darwinii TaxID=34276 RepID=A0A5D2BXT7_GOSDA|nr:hypothetical protein ES288_D07G111700v1 [Gossypium darwinii]